MTSNDDTRRADDEAIEQLLRAATPAPDVRFAAELERRLVAARPARAPRWRFAGTARAPRWRFALGTTGALAAAIVAVTLAGGGPLASNGGDDARAKPGCETVYVTEMQPTGELVRGADGVVRVETVQQPVVREVERCK